MSLNGWNNKEADAAVSILLLKNEIIKKIEVKADGFPLLYKWQPLLINYEPSMAALCIAKKPVFDYNLSSGLKCVK